MGDGKASSVIAYLKHLVEKGKLSEGAGKPLRIAFTKILQAVNGDDWQDTDVASIDVEEYMVRFTNLTLGTYSSDSLVAYKSRLNKVLSWYAQFLQEPGWSPQVGVSQKKSKSIPTVRPIKKRHIIDRSVDLDKAIEAYTPPSTLSTIATSHLVRYPFPLTSGLMAELALPQDLSRSDAKRLSAFIDSIVIEKEDKM